MLLVSTISSWPDYFTSDHIPVWRYDYLLFLGTCRMTPQKSPNDMHSIAELAEVHRLPAGMPTRGSKAHLAISPPDENYSHHATYRDRHGRRAQRRPGRGISVNGINVSSTQGMPATEVAFRSPLGILFQSPPFVKLCSTPPPGYDRTLCTPGQSSRSSPMSINIFDADFYGDLRRAASRGWRLPNHVIQNLNALN